MTGSFSGKAVIVTGASSGIGRVIAVELARHGADLWLVGRAKDELEETARQIAEAGGSVAHVAPMDLAQRGPLATLIEEIGASHPHLFALISNAGVMYPEPIMSGTVDRWQQMIDINVMAMLEGCQAAVKVMRAQGGPGHLINVGSVQARFEVPGVYGITKRAVEAIGETLREELEQDDIRVATVVPGGFTTNLSRGFLPETLANVAESFKSKGLAFGGPDTEKVLSDPRHIANIVRYILEQPIELNIQEVVIRPQISTKA
jgi:NADP-dependent 3-hydroxy acid dehydrogenase YdfG